MPHCVIECPIELKSVVDFNLLVSAVHEAAVSSNLFEQGDVKARLNVAEYYVVGGIKAPYVHTLVHLLSGRTEAQKKRLADSVTKAVCELLPSVRMVSTEVRDIPKLAYSNRGAISG
ncbi:5-carboxymethyl-2-hydroxymuconate Delta-isomerase [Shewanella sp. UCD-KL12]|uniref:5-carboxymethyl-2-hydroxymuconate Delta-isomerase n=1 Tax=Shewanella sp. UCD-KL12 TaxID=1917163 RepID=UPI000970601B|nr:hypothetical protein [Shewanella sp. UCD-KL12]